MKALITIAACICFFSFTSCKRVFVCGCTVFPNTVTAADTAFYESSSRFKAYKPSAEDFCSGEFTDSLQRKYSNTHAECFVNGVGM